MQNRDFAILVMYVVAFSIPFFLIQSHPVPEWQPNRIIDKRVLTWRDWKLGQDTEHYIAEVLRKK